MLADALESIPEDNDAKNRRLAEMSAAEARGARPPSYEHQRRWIGAIDPPKTTT